MKVNIEKNKMTTREKLIQNIKRCGVSGKDTKEIMEFIAPNMNKKMQEDGTTIDWSSDANGYIEPIDNMVFLMAKPFIAEWIEENCPQEWFKPMFTMTHNEIKEMYSRAKNSLS